MGSKDFTSRTEAEKFASAKAKEGYWAYWEEWGTFDGFIYTVYWKEYTKKKRG